jgi:probable HAF family extracellular repeat protein
MHSAVSIALIGTLVTGAAMIAGSELPDLGGGNSSFANSVNDKGDVVGRSYNTGMEEHATVWLAGGAPTDLGTLGGYKSEAKAVSSTGIIVGWSYLADYSQHAVLWSSAGAAPRNRSKDVAFLLRCREPNRVAAQRT